MTVVLRALVRVRRQLANDGVVKVERGSNVARGNIEAMAFLKLKSSLPFFSAKKMELKRVSIL